MQFNAVGFIRFNLTCLYGPPVSLIDEEPPEDLLSDNEKEIAVVAGSTTGVAMILVSVAITMFAVCGCGCFVLYFYYKCEDKKKKEKTTNVVKQS